MKQDEEDDGAMNGRGMMLVDAMSHPMFSCFGCILFLKKMTACFWILLLMGVARMKRLGINTGFHADISESLLKLDQCSLSNLGPFLVNQF